MRDKAQAILCESLGPFGKIHFPYVKMGKIDSYHLFGLDTEMVIFALYWANKHRWKKVLDIGANLGLHSILMNKLGWTVKAFEPDFQHYQYLIANLERNQCKNVKPHLAAVHTSTGEANFVRVLDNLTGNHIEGYKNSYGPRETVIVPTVDCRELFNWADFAKIDCEGNEADLLLTTTDIQMKHLDIIAEVRDYKNAAFIYEHFRRIGVPMWSQKNHWNEVENVTQMPHVNREGSLFIGHQAPFG